MQASQNSVIWTVIIAAVVLLVVSLFIAGGINSNLKLLGEKVDVDEDAIATAVLAGIEVPEYPEMPEFDELWEGIYSEKIENLEDASFIESVYQFFDDNNYLQYTDIDFSEFSENTVEEINILFEVLEELEGDDVLFFEEDDDLFDFLVDEYEEESEGLIRVQFIKEYDNKREINVINLGLDDEDDREVELSSVIRVKIFLDEDDNTEYVFDKVYIDSEVTSDDGDLEAEITYSL